MKLINTTLALLMTSVSWSCGGSGPELSGEVRPPKPTETEVPDYDFTQELSNTETRYISTNLRLNYDDAGVMVMRTDRSIRFIDMNDEGKHVIISSTVPFADIENPKSLSIIENGIPLSIKLVKIERITQSQIYLNILTANGNRIVVAVTDL